jgi:DNA-directed RNA polymerase specialized sigma24 family protein
MLERAAAGDREAFASLYDGQVGGVYRYLLAWTGDRSRAAELTGQVFRSAPRWLAATARDRAEAGAWLIAMARDAVQGPAAPGRTATAAAGPVEAVALLPDPQREVVVLRLLCGHSLDHTAHLSGYPHRAALELQLAACRSVATLTGRARPADPAIPAEMFERHLSHPQIDPTASDPVAAADPSLAVAASLRQAAPQLVTAPDPPFVQRLRQTLTAPIPAGPGAHLTHPVPGRAPRWGSVAGRRDGQRRLSTGSDRRSWRDWLSTGWGELSPSRRPWVSTAVATAGIVVALALRAFGDPGPPAACGGRPCPAPTTAVAAAAASSVGTPLTTVLQPTTTRPAATGQAPSTSPRSSPATSPPTTRPATTAPPTTAAPRPTTTTGATTTTTTPTTLPPSTTTAPAPT